MTYFGPALDPPLGGSGRKTTTLVRDHEYFIPTKFHQNPSSGFGEVENVKSLRTDGQTDGRTDRQTPDKVIPMCRYASQATQKSYSHSRSGSQTQGHGKFDASFSWGSPSSQSGTTQV